jgi:hypothetical protein
MADQKFSKGTDTEHEIKLDSELVYAAWRTGAAYGAQKVPLEVVTSFVGNGAKIKIEGKSENGKNLGKVSSTIKNNKFIGELEIPDDIEEGDFVSFTVSLPDNGLDGESNQIPAHPPIEVTNMKWNADEARRGDVMKLTADVEGVADGTEAKIIIYEYDNDNIHDVITEFPAAIEKKKIEVQWEYEYHEDTDEIPTQEELEKYGGSYNPPEYFFTITIGAQEFGKEQESGILNFKDWIEIELVDDNDEPIPEVEYEANFPDGTTQSGQLDELGKVRFDNVPPGNFTIKYKDLYPEVEEKEVEHTDDPDDDVPSVDDGQVSLGDETQEEEAGTDDDLDDDTETQSRRETEGFGTQEDSDSDTDTLEDSDTDTQSHGAV